MYIRDVAPDRVQFVFTMQQKKGEVRYMVATRHTYDEVDNQTLL
jgi:hypothetical protein